jgi:rhodanese-related sulfurtransferase
MLKKISVKELLVILAASCCIGLLFNLFHKNGIPLVAPSKAEVYARKNIPVLTPEEARGKLEGGGVIFLDARDPADFQQAHIKGALNLPVRHFDLYYPRMKDVLPKDAEIVVYCESPECNASLYLAENLIGLGYVHIVVMLKGWNAWEDLDYPSESAMPG